VTRPKDVAVTDNWQLRRNWQPRLPGTGFSAASWSPPGVVYVEPHRRRVQAVHDERVVVDTERALLVHRPGQTLTFAFPPDDVVTADLPEGS